MWVEHRVIQRDPISQYYVGSLHDWATNTGSVCFLIWPGIERVFVIETVAY